ncbi:MULTISPECIES: histidinol dehydrogenase [Gordonibacter]|uniref:Histidinol dehydrogenase n=1 Tax=Gordonibacter faecis TaxID=3047475 RepID=A0ABT7DQD1_9ACTN|nr:MULTISPECIES: histidinol dehydrogenase [unclassified Gordonibacter]MDJ1651759.1 histidinol dehydrogenase [Gordonibacter sp. KGMB12511]HIW75705.1 histidinol dehydrogenase [Candidatus Gordonibacter avicola]
MRRITLKPGEEFSNAHLKRTGAFNAAALTAATAIVEDVRERGDEALRDLTEKFDGVRVENFRVSQAAIAEAVASVDDKTAAALRKAAAQIRDFHERQKQQSWFTVREDGALVGSKIEPLDSVGIYVPGGRALYPSSVLMNALPAAVAGVPRIVCVTPPTKDGSLDPAIIEACRIAGVTEIYAVGGAQAVAALAYGTESIAPVAKITGPGNAYVAAAKKIVSGDVGIDMIAGPSEVCVVADSTADPALVAIDLMAQAEHDPLAACYLVTFDGGYANEVERMVERHLQSSTRAEITSASLADQGLIVVCETLEQAVEAVNVIAPEHLELHVDHAFDLLGAIRNAGAIFLGAWTPEAVGDYVAGPNHTLPTGGTARFSSPLSTDEFVKKSSVIQYSSAALVNDADAVMTIARHEGLWAHAMSVEMRKNLIDWGNVYGIEGGDGARCGDGEIDA